MPHGLHGARPEGPTVIEELFKRLLSVRYEYDREMAMAVQQNRAPNTQRFREVLESVWHALCVRAGLAREQGPAIPLPTEKVLAAPSQNMNELVINIARPSIHPPWPDWQLQLQSSPSTISTTSRSMSVSSALSIESPSSIGDATPLLPVQPDPLRGASSIRRPDPALSNPIATMLVILVILLHLTFH
jgi:hypothetical protein